MFLNYFGQKCSSKVYLLKCQCDNFGQDICKRPTGNLVISANKLTNFVKGFRDLL